MLLISSIEATSNCSTPLSIIDFITIGCGFVIQTVMDSGVNQFDVASIEEIKSIRNFSRTAKCSYMHTVKSRESIKEAYFNYGVKTFSLDTKDELIKIIESTNNSRSFALLVLSIIFISSSLVSNANVLTPYLK